MLVDKVLKPHSYKLTLASKRGMQESDSSNEGAPVRIINGKSATLQKTLENSLRCLHTDLIDVY